MILDSLGTSDAPQFKVSVALARKRQCQDRHIVYRAWLHQGLRRPRRDEVEIREQLLIEPDNAFWKQLLDALPEAKAAPTGVMPHPTRFVSMTGITRGGIRPPPVWIRPRPDLAQVHG